MSNNSTHALPLILVVDDDWLNRDMMKAYLERTGFRVVLAHDAPSTFSTAREQQPDLIMLDVQMGEVDGYDICRDLKADVQTEPIPVVMLSAYNSDEARERSADAGAVTFITKTLNLAQVVTSIRELLDLPT
ncbi:MAG: response regulator [Anaerolineae bacterium]|nr:response regulator [Anaerolineae bacterium]